MLAIAAALLAAAVPVDTPVRLMVLNEVNSRSAHVGDRFALRLDEAVVVDGATLVPVGATGWGEVTAIKESGAVGGKGKLGARLLYLETPDGRVPLRGERTSGGAGNTSGVVLAVVGLGPFGLLNRGGNAKLKAGDIVTGYVAGAANR